MVESEPVPARDVSRRVPVVEEMDVLDQTIGAAAEGASRAGFVASGSGSTVNAVVCDRFQTIRRNDLRGYSPLDGSAFVLTVERSRTSGVA
jgi:hypothetical protein